MTDSFHCLRHNSIIGCNNKYYDISNLCTPCTHCGKGSMTWSVKKGNLFAIHLNSISTYMLSYSSKFTIYYIGFSN